MRTEKARDRAVVLVDGNAQRAQLLGQSSLLAVGWLFEAWPVVVATGLILGVGALRWPDGSLFMWAHERWVAPRLSAVPPADGRPPRFSATLGALTLVPVGVAIAAGFESIGWAIILVNIGAMVAESVTGRCVPCELFVWAARRNLIRLAVPVAGR